MKGLSNKSGNSINVHSGWVNKSKAHKFTLPCKECGWKTPKVSRLGKALTLLETHKENCK